MDDDVSLPKSTLSKAIRDAVPSGMRVSGDAVDLILSCCNEFVHLLSTQANEISDRDGRSTISPDHVIRALEELGFTSYLSDVKGALESFRAEQAVAAKAAQRRAAGSGLSQEELLKLQEQLFMAARQRSEEGGGAVAAPTAVALDGDAAPAADGVAPPDVALSVSGEEGGVDVDA